MLIILFNLTIHILCSASHLSYLLCIHRVKRIIRTTYKGTGDGDHRHKRSSITDSHSGILKTRGTS